MLKRVITVLCSFLFAAAGFFSGCSGDPTQDLDTLYITAYQAGYGAEDWLNAIAEQFTADTGINVKVTTSEYLEGLEATVESGVATNDIYMMTQYHWNWFDEGTQYVADLTDVWTGDVYGEDIAVEDKILPKYVDWFQVDGEYYTFPAVTGTIALIYNKKVWKDEWDIPRTTDELIDLCHTAVGEGYTPFIYSSLDSYWKYGSYIWKAQYEGSEAYKAFLEGYDPDGNRYTPEVMTYQGALEELYVVEELFDPDNKFMDPYSTSVDFTTAQGYFLSGGNGTGADRKILMMMNGDWIENEMRHNYTRDELDVGIMRLPVISALGDKLGIGDGDLAKLVDWADGMLDGLDPEAPEFTISTGKDGKTYTRQEILDAVLDARSMVAPHCDLNFYVPSNSTKIDKAKMFLSYYGSDKAISALFENSYGNMSPFRYDYASDAEYMNSTGFTKEKIEYMMNPNVKWTELAGKDILFHKGGVSDMHMNGVYTYETVFSSGSMDAYQVWITNYQTVLDRWSTIKSQMGI